LTTAGLNKDIQNQTNPKNNTHAFLFNPQGGTDINNLV
jgi:hypothetical protein